ncbi:MAG: DUF1841 family protein [Gammaproteobacteria bacterium]|nr:DUF1841 family protein [Gammaproteobacteria bacterium]
MIFGQDRNELRQMYVDAWRKSRNGELLSPLEDQIAAVVAEHPEYHGILSGPEAADVRSDTTNPFLHMGLHMALREQLATDRPPGIAAVFRRFAAQSGNAHEAEHRFIDCLAETLWEAQNQGVAPDENRYMERIRRLSP